MTVARRTEGCPPTTRAKAISTTPAASAAPRRGTPTSARVAKTEEARSATLKPDTARRW